MGKTITDLTAVDPIADADLFAVVDDTDSTTKKVTADNVADYVAAELPSRALTGLDVNGNADISGTFDVGASTTRRVGVQSTLVNDAGGGPYVSSTSFDIATNIGEAWESVGPTGGGADNTWTALDSVPVDASWLKLKFVNQATISSAAHAQFVSAVYAREQGSAVATGNTTTVNAIAGYGSNSALNEARSFSEMTIPVSSRQFELYWYSLNITSETVEVYLVGWGFDPPA